MSSLKLKWEEGGRGGGESTQKRGLIALSRQGTQQQSPDSPTVAPTGMRVDQGRPSISSTKGTPLSNVYLNTHIHTPKKM